MQQPVKPDRRAPRGGGIFLMAGLLIGFGIGVWQGQGSLGILIGLVVGGAAAAWVAWRDSRRD